MKILLTIFLWVVHMPLANALTFYHVLLVPTSEYNPGKCTCVHVCIIACWLIFLIIYCVRLSLSLSVFFLFIFLFLLLLLLLCKSSNPVNNGQIKEKYAQYYSFLFIFLLLVLFVRTYIHSYKHIYVYLKAIVVVMLILWESLSISFLHCCFFLIQHSVHCGK